MVDLDEYSRKGNRPKINETEPSENTGSVSEVKSLKCNQNFACLIYVITTKSLL